MSDVKIKDEVIRKLMDEVKKKAKDVEAYELLLGMLNDIYSMNQLRGLVSSKKVFENKFRNRYRYLEEDDVKEFVSELFDFLNAFIKENSSLGKRVNIAITSELNDSEFLKISGLSGVDISPEVLDSLKKTAANTMGTGLALQNPCCKTSNLVESFFGSVSIMKIMQLMAETDGRTSVVLDKLGIKNSSNPGQRKLFSALSKSLSPALVEYSTAMVRVAVVDGVTDNLYISNASFKRGYIAMQLVVFVDWFIRNPKANYVFGEISKDELKLLYALKGELIRCCGMDFSDCLVGKQFLEMCYPRFTLKDTKDGIDTVSSDNSPVIGGSKIRRKATVSNLFVIPK